MTGSAAVEIAVQDPEGARRALGAGADRLELCQALEVGGLTPSLGILEATLSAVDPRTVNVLVRPRGGGFVYSPEEVSIVAADIRACVARGAGGVVVGTLDEAGRVDTEILRRWQDAAAGATVVFHRAIDASANPEASFDALVEVGVDRVLTSGGQPGALAGLPVLTAFVARGGGQIEIMAGGGVQVDDIPMLLAAGVDAVHLSGRARAGLDAPSGPGGGASGHDVTDVATVERAVAAARG